MNIKSNSNINDYMNIILENFDEKINKIKSIEYHYDLSSLFNVLDDKSKQEREETFELLINYYLEELVNTTSLSKVIKMNFDVNEVVEFFDYTYLIQDEEEKRYYYMIKEEADCVVDDLIYKVYGRNKRKIELPIKIKDIKDFSISNLVLEKDIDKVMFWIILKLAVIHSFSLNY